MKQPRYDTLIVGGGLAGCSVAVNLARAGRHAVLLERSSGAHDKVCGEFLSREALHYLHGLGVDVHALGAVPLRRIRLALRDAVVETELPFAAVSITRRRLDEVLLDKAAEAGAEVRRGAAVQTLQHGPTGWTARLRDAGEVHAASAVLATGKHDLRDLPRPGGTHTGLVGFKMYYQLSGEQRLALGDAVELFLFPGGYAGLQPVEGGRANLCLLVSAKRLRTCGSNWPGLLAHMLRNAPLLAERLRDAVPLLPAPLAIASIPYGHLQRAAADGLWRVGDQSAVIPSFCGDGMAIALHSGAMAAEHILAGASPDTFQRRLRLQLRSRLWFATRLSRLLVELPSTAGIVRLYPAALQRVALMTRIPDGALLRSEPHYG